MKLGLKTPARQPRTGGTCRNPEFQNSTGGSALSTRL